ncbi:unnamed protein product [Gongylonema pulchrum]|uniref:Uncharacterized protein n=1 Tax=Gongylonema pulchrum TaxID=637853 RepID=A0A3P7NEW8_9BILA|nr:unnamed protein product [Gongylonema pulchrum]
MKQELEQYKIDHNIQIKNRRMADENLAHKRRTWGGLREDGEFEPVQMPDITVSQEVQTTSAEQRLEPGKKSNDGCETTV